jgi:HSP20 family protein
MREHKEELKMLTLWRPFGLRAAAEAPAYSDFGNLFRDLSKWGFDNAAEAIAPTDVVETENAIQVKVDLPRHSLEEIEVHLEGDTLTIRAERKAEKVEGKLLRSERFYGVYSRTFVLPESVDGSKPEAQYAQGVLTITLPKREEAKPRLIKVEVKQ